MHKILIAGDEGSIRARSATAIAVICFGMLSGFAENIDQHSFSLRFPAAFSRFSSFASVTANGNAQAASEWSNSCNPASAAWPRPSQLYTNNASAMFSAVRFDQGTDVYVAGAAAVLCVDELGAFVPCAVQIHSNHAPTSAGNGYEMDADYFHAQWGKQIAEDWAVGMNVNFTGTETKFDLGGAPLSHTQSDAYGFRIGSLHQATQTLRLGLVVDYSWSPSWTEKFSPASARTADETQRVLARPGVVWQFTPRGKLYLDYQGGVFWNNTGSLWVHRFPIGVEYWLVPGLLVGRMGTTADTFGDASVSAGLGVQIGSRVFVNIAYQDGTFPELRQEFGEAHTFALSLGVGF